MGASFEGSADADVGDEAIDVLTDGVPAVAGCFTVKEVMQLYRIGRCTAYEQARRCLDDGPGHGIPCIRLGHSLRFPVSWIEAHIGSTQVEAE
jgi:hypothetical protein